MSRGANSEKKGFESAQTGPRHDIEKRVRRRHLTRTPRFPKVDMRIRHGEEASEGWWAACVGEVVWKLSGRKNPLADSTATWRANLPDDGHNMAARRCQLRQRRELLAGSRRGKPVRTSATTYTPTWIEICAKSILFCWFSSSTAFPPAPSRSAARQTGLRRKLLHLRAQDFKVRPVSISGKASQEDASSNDLSAQNAHHEKLIWASASAAMAAKGLHCFHDAAAADVT